MYNKYKSLTVTTVTAWVLVALIVACAFALPYLASLYIGQQRTLSGLDGDVTGREDEVKALRQTEIALYVCLYASAIPALVGTFLLLKILKNVKRNAVFEDSNVICLRYISWCCCFAALCYFTLGFFVLFSFVVAAASAFAGLIVRVIKNLMKEAVDIKRENDLTV